MHSEDLLLWSDRYCHNDGSHETELWSVELVEMRLRLEGGVIDRVTYSLIRTSGSALTATKALLRVEAILGVMEVT